MEGDVELHEMPIPVAFQGSWMKCSNPVSLRAYLLKFIPIPPDREYTQVALFLESSLPKDIETLSVELHLSHSRRVRTEILSSGNMKFNPIQLRNAMQFQEVFLKAFLEREAFRKSHVWLTKQTDLFDGSSTSYLLLPVEIGGSEDMFDINWTLIEKCLSSPVFYPERTLTENDKNAIQQRGTLKLVNGWFHADEIQNSLVVTSHNNDRFFYIVSILSEMNGHSMLKKRGCTYAEYYKTKYGIILEYPQQPLLQAKGAFVLRNLLHPRQNTSESKQHRGKHNEEFLELPPELCCIKLTAFSTSLARSISLLPSMMHRLESLLLAAELKEMLTNAFPEGIEVSIMTIHQAITTEKCSEGFSLERLEILGDAFLKYALSSYLFLKNNKANEGQLSPERSSTLNNTSLYEKGKAKGFQAYIRDECFDPKLFFTLGRPCPRICTSDTMHEIHFSGGNKAKPNYYAKCNRRHRWLHKKTIADVVEALIGACLVDSGARAALAFLNWIGVEIEISSHLIQEAQLRYKDISQTNKCISIDDLQNLTRHEFMHKSLLLEAFTHASYDTLNSYQRLEYLGDAVLDYLMTSYFYSMYPNVSPGYLTDMKAMTVNNEALAAVSVRRNLYLHIIHNSPPLLSRVTRYADSFKEMKQDDLEESCPKVLGDIVESLAGAILLDSGFDMEHVWNIMVELIEPTVTLKTLQLQPDRELLELADYHHLELKYSGDEIGSGYHVKAHVSGKDVHVEGEGVKLNRKVARKSAAQDALTKLKEHNLVHQIKRLKEVIENFDTREPKLIGFNKQDRLKLVDEVPSPASAHCLVNKQRESDITSIDEASISDEILDSQSPTLCVDTSCTSEMPENNTTEINVQSPSSASAEIIKAEDEDNTQNKAWDDDNTENNSQHDLLICSKNLDTEMPENNTTEINVQCPPSSSAEIVKAQDDDNTQNEAQDDDNTQNNSQHVLLICSKKMDTEMPENNTTEINVQSPPSSSAEIVKAQDEDNTQNKAQDDDNTQNEAQDDDNTRNNSQHVLLICSKKLDTVDEASIWDKTLDSRSFTLPVDTSCTSEMPENSTMEINVQGPSSSSAETFKAQDEDNTQNKAQDDDNAQNNLQHGLLIYSDNLDTVDEASICDKTPDSQSSTFSVDTSSTSEMPENSTTEINIQSPSSSSAEIVKSPNEDNTQHTAQDDGNTQKNSQHGLLIYSENLDTGQYLEPARSYLNYFCQKHGCEPPSWECIKEEGLPHCKSFTYKVVLKIPESTVESVGKPSKTKKLAMESAAEALRWWLRNQEF